MIFSLQRSRFRTIIKFKCPAFCGNNSSSHSKKYISNSSTDGDFIHYIRRHSLSTCRISYMKTFGISK